jgi:DNA-binding transcriptional LysR family regulator
MELRQLEYLVAVAEEANFTRGADRVHVSQSGISAQIRQLERDLGVELFDRSGRTATLTAAGQAAIVHARAMLASAAALRQAVDELNGLVRGELTVGMVTACTVEALFDALSAFHRAYPGIEITLTEDHSGRLVDQVRAGTIDLALIGAAGDLPEGVDGLTVISENLVAAVPPGHLLAGRASISLAELAGYPVISMPVGTGVRAVFDQACAAVALQPSIALQASAPSAVADLASRGLGVAIFSATMATFYSDRLTAVPVTGVAAPSLLALVWSTSPSSALREFLAYARDAFGMPEARPGMGRASVISSGANAELP